MQEAYCPNKCEAKTFFFTAHVTQDWIIDSRGLFQECTNECEDVTHGPTSSDYWICTECGTEAKFRENIKREYQFYNDQAK